MFKSKIFLKSIFMVIGIVVIYSVAINLFAIPKFNSSIQHLEQKNAQDTLHTIETYSHNVYENLKQYKKQILKQHKKELMNLTDTAWSIIQSKYEQSKEKNIGGVLEIRGKRFEELLMNFYNKNKNTMDKKRLQKEIKSFINIYRYNNGAGYFWINDFTPNMVFHPISKYLNGKSLKNYKDKNGKYLFNDMVKICKEKGSGTLQYKWLNPLNNKVENKISYVFTFKPYHWIIGTGEYKSILKANLKKDVINIVRNLRYGNNNYFFIYDYNNIAISHPYIQGKDMSKVVDKKGNLIVPPFVQLAQKKGEGFTRYWWTKNSVDGKAYEKLTYVKNFPEWDMVIATGIFIDDINKEVKKRKLELMTQLKDIIKSTVLGKSGYLYIFDSNGNIIMHPNDNLTDKNLKTFRNFTTGNYIFDDLVKSVKTSSGHLHYIWDKPTDKGNYIYEKEAWTTYIPELNWYVSATLYTEDLHKSSISVGNFVYKLSILIFILATIYSMIYFKNLLNPIIKLSKLASSVAQGNYKVRAEVKRDDEIGELSNSFNKMIDTTEDLIDNLDKKIDIRTKELIQSNKKMKSIHKHTVESIEYASLIQSAILPDNNILSSYFRDNFVMWTPKDTVGGDIWLFNELRHKDECLLYFIDCTGHGVPGAFVTMIVKAIEQQILAKIEADRYRDISISPAWIMGYFNQTMKKLLKQETQFSRSNAGFDGGIIYYNRRTQILKFAGAETSLFYITKDGEFNTIKGNRYSVGYKKCDKDYEYKETTIDVQEGMKFYCTTDGYLDQNGGEKDFPFGKKRFTNIIKEHYQKDMKTQQIIFKNTMDKYESLVKNCDRNDDMTLIGFEIGAKSDIEVKEIQEIIKYEGIITQNVVSSCMDNIEFKIHKMNIQSIISTITIEYCQNMMNYSKNAIAGDREITSAGSIDIKYINHDYYEITSVNIVAVEDKQKIEPKLKEVQILDKQGIKKRYRELRKSGQNTHSKGGGIGVYEIAKISDYIEYEFININDDKYYFTMTSIVHLKKKEQII